MALAVLTLACLLLYATSRYFPSDSVAWTKRHQAKVTVMASVISLVSLYLFTLSYDFSTALMFWLIAFMTLLSAIILSVKINTNWMWVWWIICLLFIIVDVS
ncbi:MAG: hypothetical protein AAF944_28895 [Bacteroidota bacterium]